MKKADPEKFHKLLCTSHSIPTIPNHISNYFPLWNCRTNEKGMKITATRRRGESRFARKPDQSFRRFMNRPYIQILQIPICLSVTYPKKGSLSNFPIIIVSFYTLPIPSNLIVDRSCLHFGYKIFHFNLTLVNIFPIIESIPTPQRMRAA